MSNEFNNVNDILVVSGRLFKTWQAFLGGGDFWYSTIISRTCSGGTTLLRFQGDYQMRMIEENGQKQTKEKYYLQQGDKLK